jgi:hypothetical protein
MTSPTALPGECSIRRSSMLTPAAPEAADSLAVHLGERGWTVQR